MNLEVQDTPSKNCKHSLHYHSAMGNMEMCNYLLSNGFEINKDDGEGWTPVMHAIRNGKTSCVNHLIYSGAKINYFKSFGLDILQLAIASGILSTVELVVDLSDITDLISEEYIYLACAYGFNDILRYLIEKIFKFAETQSKEGGMTPLMLAVAGGHKEVVRTLLEFKANLDIKNSLNQTALDIAIELNNEQIQALLGRPIPVTPLYFQHFLFPGEKKKMDYQPSYNATSIESSQCTKENFYLNGSLVSFNCDTLQLKMACCNNLSCPLTPNTYLSPKLPKKKELTPRQQKYKNCFNFTTFRMRSRSLGQKNGLKSKRPDKNESKSENILEYILQSEKLSDYWTIFKKEQVSLQVFLTMDEEDLVNIGINKNSIRQKVLKVITHYKRVFSLY